MAKLEATQGEATKAKERVLQIMGNYQIFKKTFDDVSNSLLPKCKSMLNIDHEYIRVTILNNRESMD